MPTDANNIIGLCVQRKAAIVYFSMSEKLCYTAIEYEKIIHWKNI